MEATLERTILTADEQAVLDAELAAEFHSQNRIDLACVGDCKNCPYERVCDF